MQLPSGIVQFEYVVVRRQAIATNGCGGLGEELTRQQ